MDFKDNYLLDSGFFTQSMADNANTYGPVLTKYDYVQQPTSLGSTTAFSSYSSGSSSSSSSGSFARNESFIMQPTTSPPMVKEEIYDDEGLDMLMALPSPPKGKPPSCSKTGVKKSNQGGRKRSIIFEQEEAEIQRKEFLERNRIAASKCRQKKKRWMKGLEGNYEKLSTQNQRLRSMVMMFQDEVNSLKTELLTRNGLCSCTDMRTYFQQNYNTASTMDPRNSIAHAHYISTSQSMTMSPTSLPSVAPPEPNAFLPDNTLPPLSLSLPPYLNE